MSTVRWGLLPFDASSLPEPFGRKVRHYSNASEPIGENTVQKKSSSPRRLGIALTSTALAASAVLLAAGTASAKSGVSVAVSTHSLRLGQSVHVSGAGGDDAVRLTYLCVDLWTSGTGWKQLTCTGTASRTVSADARASRRGTEQFRVRLLARHYAGGPLVLDRVSGAASVLVH
jgi:hypothetical protein